ncbi:hypothetical protein ACVOMV_21480 [Mesorhizobium atlanticum]
MQAVTLLGPRSMDDIYEAALATLAPSLDRRDEFEAHFRSYFYGDAKPSIEGRRTTKPGSRTTAARARKKTNHPPGERRRTVLGA